MSVWCRQSSVSSDEDTVAQSLRGRGMEKLDDWCGKWSDRCNPILIKETRQVLKVASSSSRFRCYCLSLFRGRSSALFR